MRIYSILLFGVLVLSVLAEQKHRQILILLEQGDGLSVVELEKEALELTESQEGILVWREGGLEQWKHLVPGLQWKKEKTESKVFWGKTSEKSIWEIAQKTNSLEQIFSYGATRGSGFITPFGVVLDGRITLRRKSPFVKRNALLKNSDGKILLVIPFSESQACISWQNLVLPEKFPKSLLPGQYTLEMEGVASSTTAFWVAEPTLKKEVIQFSDLFQKAFGKKYPLLHLQITLEALLYAKDKEGRQQAYLCDALDAIEDVKEDSFTPYLLNIKKKILSSLGALSQKTEPKEKNRTGIEEIDIARQYILASRWQDAWKILETCDKADRRTRGLSYVYLGVVCSESSLTREQEADSYFQKALQELDGGLAADLFLAHNNYGNFLSSCVQDFLCNQAFQRATEKESPLLDMLDAWKKGLLEYEKAYRHAQDIDKQEVSFMEANLARHYALLGDIVRLLEERPGQFKNIGQQAQRKANEFTEKIRKSLDIAQTEPFLYGTAWAIYAHLVFREDRIAECLEACQKAISAYCSAGSLTGIESIARILGLCYRKANKAEEALENFTLSSLLGEILRSRMVHDKIGLSQAGFFSRRTYVYENIAELLLVDGKAKEALLYVEKAKAQSLQNLLNVHGIKINQDKEGLEEILSKWPKEICALEYFVGTNYIYAFFVDVQGQVRAFKLEDKDKKPVFSPDMVARIHIFLKGLRPYASKMLSMIKEENLNHDWQKDLHSFYQSLLPAGILEEMRRAKTVMLIPHHILHYFPFSALVVQPDKQELHGMCMAKPKFLVDEPFDLCYVPSLQIWKILRERKLLPIQQVFVMAMDNLPGYPLPGVKKDVESIQAVFGKLPSVYWNEKATKKIAFQIFRKRGLVVLGTHGTNNPDQPMESSLVFPSDSEGNSCLSSAEIYETKISSDIVVLNACYGSLANRTPMPGDDLFGLSRAFLQSGAKNVLSGFWDIYDGTAPILLKGFAESLARGIPAHASLAISQRNFLKQLRASSSCEPWLHPYFWAVYQIQGDDRITMKIIPDFEKNLSDPENQAVCSLEKELRQTLEQKLNHTTRSSKRILLHIGNTKIEQKPSFSGSVLQCQYKEKVWAEVTSYIGTMHLEKAAESAKEAATQEIISGYLISVASVRAESQYTKSFQDILSSKIGRKKAKKFSVNLVLTREY
ncbi:MAG: CHAT domain-containing protein [Candidatus Brocadiae bacterium]|nr:CHAT domain-containing protein [Candidatus Brocadiia bacterium]